ncbi:inclusion body family protein [Pseudomonas sp. B21-040]|uniref:AidA/PixA family protein n=1 Tax=unclassified Pseudomonas TaxID=196821 RepID=UPI000D6B921C|nr:MULTISPECIES: AidA/PixA family protein [unclassified Pseudomonas]PWK32132.1 inclusion body protein [Pseudomonas sp. OV226]UVL43469.1 inclusion body family protein [Pseudomonas sp. B21-040]
MTSEPINAPSSANNILLIVDAESLLSRYPQPSLKPPLPTVIEEGFILVIAGGKSTINDSKITLHTSKETTFHLRGRTISLLAEHSVVFYEISVGDAGVLSAPELVVHGNLTVPVPDPATPTEPGNHQADDHYWKCTRRSSGVETCELNFMLIDKNCEALGYFSWAVEVEMAD